MSDSAVRDGRGLRDIVVLVEGGTIERGRSGESGIRLGQLDMRRSCLKRRGNG